MYQSGDWLLRAVQKFNLTTVMDVFGDFGEGYLRFSVANSIENIEKALDRIDAWTKNNL